MKKLLVTLLVLLALGTLAIYVFIPSTIKVSKLVFVHTTDRQAVKLLSSPAEWNKWFPGKKDSGSAGYAYKDQRFFIDTVYYNAVNINLEKDGSFTSSKIQLLPVKKDSIGVMWECSLEGGVNPLHRLKQYAYAVTTKQNMTAILDQFKIWTGSSANVYGVLINHGKIQDSVLLSTKTTFDQYPSNEQVYELLNRLRTYFGKYGAREVGIPMLNVTVTAPGVYQTQVAIPIDKDVPQTDDTRMKYMFKGNALTTEVTGGNYIINKALSAMEQYRADYVLMSPAIPFQSLVTDRLKEKDTTKWKTILYYPIR